MLVNINDPHATHILAAAAHIGRMKDACRVFILQDFEQRQLTFGKMKAECIALEKLSESAFANNFQEIKKLTELLIREIDRIAKLNTTSSPGNCKVCDKPLKTVKTHIKDPATLTFCTGTCSLVIFDLLGKLEGPTEVMWI